MEAMYLVEMFLAVDVQSAVCLALRICRNHDDKFFNYRDTHVTRLSSYSNIHCDTVNTVDVILTVAWPHPTPP